MLVKLRSIKYFLIAQEFLYIDQNKNKVYCMKKIVKVNYQIGNQLKLVNFLQEIEV